MFQKKVCGTSPNHSRLDCANLTYYNSLSLTPWSRAILERPTCSQLVKKFPAFYWNRRFISAFTRALHLSLLWFLQFAAPLPTCFKPLGSSSGAYLYIHSLCTAFLVVYGNCFSFYIVFERSLCKASVNVRVPDEKIQKKPTAIEYM